MCTCITVNAVLYVLSRSRTFTSINTIVQQHPKLPDPAEVEPQGHRALQMT